MSSPAPATTTTAAPVPTQPKITVTAHQSHWYDVLASIFQGLSAANPFLISFIPAPIEAGIQIATTLEPVVAGTIQAATQSSGTGSGQ